MEMIGISHLDIGSANLAYRVFGTGKINVVIESALNSCGAEWWHIGEALAGKYTVLVYDRAGYGASSASRLARTPKNIAGELRQLLAHLEVERRVILVGHSQGGLYVQQYSRLYPDSVKGVVLIDPLSANDNRFKELLSADDYARSGVGKVKNLKMGYWLARIGLGFLLRPLLKKAPPFYYYDKFSAEAADCILRSSTRARQYKTAIDEYLLSHADEHITDLKAGQGFPSIPLVLITHTSEIAVEENMHYGGISRELAERVEGIWQEIMAEYLTFSAYSVFMQAKASSHYVHLTEYPLLEAALAKAAVD